MESTAEHFGHPGVRYGVIYRPSTLADEDPKMIILAFGYCMHNVWANKKLDWMYG